MDILLFEPPYKCQDKLRDVKPAWRVQIDSNGSVVSEPIESCLPGTYLPPMTHWCCSRAPCFLKGMCVPTDSLPSHKSASDSLGWGGVGWDNNVIGISTWSWCYALWSSLAFPHDLDATLYDLHWHFHMNLMLRSRIFNCNSTWSWCYALWSSIAIPHDLDATFYDLQLAFPHDLDATLYDLHWHFHMILMLRSMIFTGISTWTWCYSLWSSIAIPHELDATLYDLHWHFHMILMLRRWSSLAFPHELDATLYDIQCEKKLRLPFLRLKCWKGCHYQSRRTFFSIGFECKNWLLAGRK